MLSALAVYKNGHSSRMAQVDNLHVTFNPSYYYLYVTVAAGAGRKTSVKEASHLNAAIAKGFKVLYNRLTGQVVPCLNR